ncbi:long-chain-fatty-acid--CoA ligase FadD13-like [Haliotis cracherodii]|uniref:long-chain-fatty-acid--CoA ligase FadD13-like n=1 Tax=Haliotis cracherodii TaxID=6455 RepID=UPI0039ECC269
MLSLSGQANVTSEVTNMNVLTVPARLKFWTQKYPNMPAFVFEHPLRQRTVMTFNDVTTLAGKFASRLQKLGVKKGDVVCSTLPNCPERVVCDFGVMTAGAITIPGTTVLSDGSDILHNLQKSGSKVLVVNPVSGVWQVVREKVHLCSSNGIQSEVLPDLRTVIFIHADNEFLDSLRKQDDPHPIDIPLEPTDLATILHTSGSTGYSKLVSTTHERLFRFSQTYVDMHNLNLEKTIYRDRPLGWSGGFPFFCLEGPATQFLLDDRFQMPNDNIGFIWNLICREKISTMFATPPFVLSLLARNDLHSNTNWIMDIILIAGQCVKSNLAPAIGKLCRELGVGYGSSEAGICCHQRYTAPEQLMDFNVGKVYPGCQLLVVDDDLLPVESGTRGQFIVKSNGCFTEYYNDPETNRKAFTHDGWFMMDDIGFKNADGNVFVQGRKSDLIMKGINKVYPSWLETQMLKSPLIHDVTVVPVPDDVYINEICACVIPSRPDVHVQDVRTLCDGLFRQSASSDVSTAPKYFIFLQAFPCNNAGKVDKKALIQIAIEEISNSC